MSHLRWNRIIFAAIILLALLFRLNNVNWDEGHHLHPDERFLTMVSNAMEVSFLERIPADDPSTPEPETSLVLSWDAVPSFVSSYLNREESLLNPANVGYEFFVYGTFPLVFSKVFAVLLDMDSYGEFTVLGRVISALFDVGVIFVIFLIVSLFERTESDLRKRQAEDDHDAVQSVKNDILGLSPGAKYWAAFLYAIAVLPIQLSHFFAVDTFLTFFMVGSAYFALRFLLDGPFVGEDLPPRRWVDAGLSGICMGLAIASKLNAVVIMPLLAAFFLLAFIFKTTKDSRIQFIWKAGKVNLFRRIPAIGAVAFVFVFCMYATLRIASPYYFEEPSFFNPQPSEAFLSNISSLKAWEGPDVWYPPAIQWVNKPAVAFSLVNMMVFGMGIPFFMFSFLGMVILLYRSIPLFLNSVGSPHSDSERGPPISLPRACRGVVRKRVSHSHSSQDEVSSSKFWLLTSDFWIIILLIILTWVVAFFLWQSSQFVKALRYFIFLYPFLAIFGALGIQQTIDWGVTISQGRFFQNTTFIRRSMMLTIVLVLLIWPLMFSSIYVNRNTRVVASEWIYEHISEESLILTEHWDDPLPLLLPNQTKVFTGEQLPIFGMDDEEKWRQMDDLLERGDYYIMSSNRGWGSIPTVPEKYPRMTTFYADLFAEKTEYTKVAEFTSYPSLEYLGIPLTLPDDWADETFTVYDHPKVMIYQKKEAN